MPGIEAKVIQELDEQIKQFKKIIETAGKEGGNRLESIAVD